jgi:hypothetical protein
MQCQKICRAATAETAVSSSTGVSAVIIHALKVRQDNIQRYSNNSPQPMATGKGRPAAHTRRQTAPKYYSSAWTAPKYIWHKRNPTLMPSPCVYR